MDAIFKELSPNAPMGQLVILYLVSVGPGVAKSEAARGGK